MQISRARFLHRVVVPITTVAGISLAGSSPASAHEGPEPVGNLGDAVGYATGEVQKGHLDQPMLGLGGLVENPTDYVGGHVVPFAQNLIGLAATGHAPIEDDGSMQDPMPDEEVEEPEPPVHEH